MIDSFASSYKLELLHKLDDCSQHHLVDLTPAECERFFEHFDRIAYDLVKAINAIVPPMQFGKDNPNNGHTHHKYRIGREYSRVIYVELIAAYFKDPAADVQSIAKQIEAIGAKADADERESKFDVSGSASVRLWWD